MKLTSLLSFVALLGTIVSLHAETVVAGPKGGRLLAAEPHQAEFFVTADRKVEITFYDAALTPVAPGEQTVTLFAEPATGRVQLPLQPTPTGFVSTTPLPVSAAPYRIVVQTRAAPVAKPKNFRIDLELATCAECGHAEYACTCESH
jgi:hypothetical protein